MSARRLTAAVLLLAVLAGGLVTGLGTGGRANAGTRTALTATVSGTSTSSTPTQPSVTLLPPSSTTPARSLPGYNRPPVVVGDMNTPEQFLLGALYQSALSHAGFTVSITRNIGDPYSAQQAMKQGSLSVYPDYLVSWDRNVAGLKAKYPSAAKADAAGTRYARHHGFELLSATPGSDTLGLAVTSQFARENDLHSMAQLGRVPLLTYGMPLNFGGLWRAEKAYGFKPGVVQSILTGTQYQALQGGSVQVAYAGSTDPQLAEPGYTLLADPKHVYGFGNIVPVTTPKVIREEGPAFVKIINRVDALLTTTALRGLNTEVQIMNHDQNAVADQFLQGNGLLPTDGYQVSPPS